MKRLIVDLDETICFTVAGDYANSRPNIQFIERLREYQNNGFEIVVFTARNMRTFEGSIGKINAVTLPIIIDWLTRYAVPYDEIIVGKPWCGFDGFYIDDRAIRPSEFVSLSYDEVLKLVEKSK